MYLKFEIPGGYFRIYDSVTNVITPKGNSAIVFPEPKEECHEDNSLPEGTLVRGICWKDAYEYLTEDTKFEVARALGLDDSRVRGNVEFNVISRQGCVYYSLVAFLGKDQRPHFICTQYPAFLCNDDGKTIEKI